MHAEPMERHQPRKRFGQCFLVDPHYVARIVAAIAPRPGDNLVEIGPGQAALTRPLLAAAGHLTAIELDRDLAARLSAEFAPEALSLHVGDALKFDFGKLGARLRIVGNLPYNISSPLLFHLAQFDSQIADAHVMLQREVVARMTAAPATPDYGRLTVMLQSSFRVTRLFTVPAGAFRPLGDARPRIADPALFARIVAAAFGQRRKTLRNALLPLCDERALESGGIDPGARGETLAVADFVRLANLLSETA